MDPSALLLKLNNGDISNIVPELKVALAGQGHSSFAHRVVLRISNLCIKSSGRADPVISDEDEALQLVLLCVQAIDVDSAVGSQIPANCRTITAVFNVLSRFYGNRNFAHFVKTLNAFLPVLEKMSASMGDQEHKGVIKYVTLIQNILLSESTFKEDPHSEISPLNLWNLMLRVCALVNSKKFITQIFSVMSSMAGKYENHYGSNGYEKVLDFNQALLESFIAFSEARLSKFDADEDNINNIFGVLTSTLWRFLRVHVKSGSISNLYKTIDCMAKFVSSCLCAHSQHIECFNLIVRILKTFFFQDKHSSNEKYFICELQHYQKVLEGNKTKGISPPFQWVIFIAGCAVTSFITAEAQTKKNIFTVELLTSMHHFTLLLAELLETSNTAVCQASGQTCSYKKDATLAFKTVNIFTTLSMECMKDNQEGLTSLLPLIESSLTLQQSIMEKAVEGKCVKADLLQNMFSDIAYSVGNLCYSTSHWKYSQTFLQQSLKYLYSDRNSLSSIQKQKVFSLLSRLLVACEKQELWEEAKVSALLHVMLHLKLNTPQHPFVRHQWTSLQNANQANMKTTIEFFKHKSLLFKSICPGFDFDEKLVPGLLLWELSCYSVDRLESSDTILNAWLALKETKASPLMLLEGSAMACQALFSCSDKVNWYDLISGSLLTWFSRVKVSEKAVSLCLMAVHYQIKFLMHAQKHFDENEFKVEEVAVYSQNPALVKQPQDVISPGDVCLVRSTFPNLNLQREQKLMDLLDTAINYWNDSLHAGLCLDHCAVHPSIASSGEYLLQISFLYTLWGYNTGAAKAFQVCLKFAKKMNMDDLQLQALSGLMNIVEVKKELIAEADALLVRLKDHPKISYMTQCYLTSRAFQSLRTASYIEGMNALQEVIDCTPTASSVWCYAYAKLLQASYSVLPKSKLDQTALSGSICAARGLSYCVQSVQDKRLSNSPLIFAALVNQALLISLWIGRYFLCRQMPKQARTYMKAELMLALKLGLATRAAEFICELAFVDLLSEKVEEASAKIIDLQCILGRSETSQDNGDHGDAIEEGNEVDALELVPPPKPPGSNLGSSPLLESKEMFYLPISRHGSSCNCYMCRNYSVQNTWLMYSHLQAKINLLRFDVHKSYGIYKKALRAAGFILQKFSRPACSSELCLQQHQVACTEISLRLDFVDMLFMYGKDTEALKVNSAVLEAFKSLKTDENLLLGCALEQKMCIIEIMDGKRKDFDKAAVKTPETQDGLYPGSPRLSAEKTPEQSACISTPHVAGKRRQPLKRVEAGNHLIVPLTDQFFTPKSNFYSMIQNNDSDDELTSQTSKENFSSPLPKFRNLKYTKREGVKNTAQNLSGQEVQKTKELAMVKNTASNKVVKPLHSSKAKAEDVPISCEAAVPRRLARGSKVTSEDLSGCGEAAALKNPASSRRAATAVGRAMSSQNNLTAKAADTRDVVDDKIVAPQKKGTARNLCTKSVVAQKTVSVTNTRLASSKSDLECSKAAALKVRKDATLKADCSAAAKVSGEPKRQTRQRKT